MSPHEHAEDRRPPDRKFPPVRFGIVLVGFLLIAGALLFTEHRAHVFGILIWLPILACPLMHIFMHGGHGGHSSHGDQDQRGRSAS
jgi:DUF2933 family protein